MLAVLIRDLTGQNRSNAAGQRRPKSPLAFADRQQQSALRSHSDVSGKSGTLHTRLLAQSGDVMSCNSSRYWASPLLAESCPSRMYVSGRDPCFEKDRRLRKLGYKFNRSSGSSGRFHDLTDASVDRFCYALICMPKQSAGMPKVVNLAGCLRPDIPKLELPDVRSELRILFF